MSLQKKKGFFAINSLPRRVRASFLSIILLLFFSGATSLLELERVSHDTEEILLASKLNVELAGEMISALNEQNDAMIYMAVVGDNSEDHRIRCINSIEHLSTTTRAAYDRLASTENTSSVDSLLTSAKNINALAQDYLDKRVHLRILEQMQYDSLTPINTQIWYADNYKAEYMNVSRQITRFMTGANSSLGPSVNRLSNTARRAVTPVFISLIVMLVVVLMLYYFMRSYLVNPIMRINKNLEDYITYKSPFDKTIPCRDEMVSLRDNIIKLIDKLN